MFTTIKTTANHGHVHTPVKIGPYTVYATGSKNLTWEVRMKYDVKDWAFYLDTGTWSGAREFNLIPYSEATSKIPIIEDDFGKIVAVRWPDMGVIGIDRFTRLVGLATRALKRKQSVEIGCIGAHGRTGTLLAGLFVKIENLSSLEPLFKRSNSAIAVMPLRLRLKKTWCTTW